MRKEKKGSESVYSWRCVEEIIKSMPNGHAKPKPRQACGLKRSTGTNNLA